MNYRLIDEIMEFLWIKLEDEKMDGVPLDMLDKEFRDYYKNFQEILNILQEFNYIKIKNNKIYFAEKGRARAIHIIRSHRLAERLFTDVLNIKNDANLEKQACSFEHTIDDSIEAAICTLLGHPQICPHGFRIPPGPCCKKSMREFESVIKPLNELKVGESGTCLYFTTNKNDIMHRLMSIGIIPGVELKIHQKMPFNGPIVVQIDQTQYALDPSIAKNIYVRISNSGPKDLQKEPIPGPKRHKRGRRFKGKHRKHD